MPKAPASSNAAVDYAGLRIASKLMVCLDGQGLRRVAIASAGAEEFTAPSASEAERSAFTRAAGARGSTGSECSRRRRPSAKSTLGFAFSTLDSDVEL